MYQIDKRLTEILVRDLPLNSRQQLSSYLNIEHVLKSDNGLARDYRGLAQQLDLSYSEIAQLEKLHDPCGSLLNYQKVSKLSVYELFELIISIGRYDILDDMIPFILNELVNLNDRHKNQMEVIDQVVEEKKCTIWYDAYVCYADNDLEFVRQLAEYLESPNIGFRLFIRDRDLLVGNWVYDTFARLIETQCRRMIIILSPDFLLSPDCKFQSLFAAGLAIEKCSRILVPIVYKPCDNIPSILRLMSKIDMTDRHKNNLEWNLGRLVMSIRDESSRPISKPKMELLTHSNNNNNQTGSNNNQLSRIEMPSEQTNTQQTIKLNNFYKTDQTNISVISNENTIEDESTKLIDSFNSGNSNNNQYLPMENDTGQLSSNANGRSSKSWIKTIKKKIKVGL